MFDPICNQTFVNEYSTLAFNFYLHIQMDRKLDGRYFRSIHAYNIKATVAKVLYGFFAFGALVAIAGGVENRIVCNLKIRHWRGRLGRRALAFTIH